MTGRLTAISLGTQLLYTAHSTLSLSPLSLTLGRRSLRPRHRGLQVAVAAPSPRVGISWPSAGPARLLLDRCRRLRRVQPHLGEFLLHLLQQQRRQRRGQAAPVAKGKEKEYQEYQRRFRNESIYQYCHSKNRRVYFAETTREILLK